MNTELKASLGKKKKAKEKKSQSAVGIESSQLGDAGSLDIISVLGVLKRDTWKSGGGSVSEAML